MRLVARELDKLLLHQVGYLAQKRLARGVKLNYAETTALIASQLQELIRDGNHSVANLMDLGKQMLGRRHVLPDVLDMLHEIQVEGTFRDGTYLVTVHDPICTDDGNLELALYGSFLPIPSADRFPLDDIKEHGPGAVVVKPGNIVLNEHRERVSIKVTNNGDRPVQVGSHYHFIETNPLLSFNRGLAYGKRLDIPAGTAIRFEPGESKTVTLCAIGGNKVITGGNKIASGPVNLDHLENVMEKVKSLGFSHVDSPPVAIHASLTPYTISREVHNEMYGPTTGDLVRLGDTNLWARVERDLTIPGDECKFGGGKVLREGMGQMTGISDKDSLDLVITNALIIDWTGIYKADVGVKDGLIAGIGKAGNPDIMDGVTDGMVIGANTEALAGEGLILTAGAVDSHIHFICPEICEEAICSGITTLIGGGTGPAEGTKATTCTPGKNHIEMMLRASDDFPLNFGFTGKGNSSSIHELQEQIQAGCVGLKLHEDWGTTPSAIDTCLTLCDEQDVQCIIHTDTLNESGFVESTIAAFKDRTIHTYHSEGAGGGHAPDIIRVVGEPSVLPSSTNPTRPYTTNTLDEHLDMLMVCHHLSRNIPEDVAFAESRIRAETIAAEDVLHDLGAISMISSDSQAMGRVGEVVLRTWKTAHKMKLQRGKLPEDKDQEGDNYRIRRYIAKYTINPAIAHGMSHLIGSVEVGKLADLAFYKPAFFGSKAEMVLKGGMIVRAFMGDANASIPTVQPILSRKMYAASPSALAMSCITFVSALSISTEQIDKYNLRKRVEAVRNCRGLSKRDMRLNDALPKIEVDPETYRVVADGVDCACDPVDALPLTQSVYLF